MAKKIMKVPIGIPVLDDKFSGIYVGHVTFLTGASGEGREVAVGAALNNYYRLDEHVLAVFAESADHVALRAREVGYDLESCPSGNRLRKSSRRPAASRRPSSSSRTPDPGLKFIPFLPLQSASRNSSRHSKNPGLPPSWPCPNPSPPPRRRCGGR